MTILFTEELFTKLTCLERKQEHRQTQDNSFYMRHYETKIRGSCLEMYTFDL